MMNNSKMSYNKSNQLNKADHTINYSNNKSPIQITFKNSIKTNNHSTRKKIIKKQTTLPKIVIIHILKNSKISTLIK